MHQAVEPGIQHTGCGNNMISADYGISEGSSDENDFDVPVDCEDCACCVCGERFPFLDQLLEHLKTHKGRLCCHLCMANFDRAVSLALHLKNAHPKYHLFCTPCRVSFRSTWHLNEHLEKHHQEVTAIEEKMDVKAVVKIEEMENGVMEKSVMSSSMDSVFLHDHSYCVPVHLSLSMESSRKQNIIKERQTRIHSPSTSCSSSGLCSNDDLSSDCSSYESEPHFDEEYVIPGDGESTDSTEEDADILPPGDTEYCPEEDLSSDSQCSAGSDTDDSRSSSGNRHQKTERRKEMDTEMKTSFANHSMNPGSFTCEEKMDFKTGSLNSTVVKKEENVNDCEKKPSFICCMCNAACETKDVLLKHFTEKHPTAVYICSCCLNAFTQQDAFKRHVCWNRTTGQMNILLPPTVPQLPAVQRTTSAHVLSTKPVEIQMFPRLLPQSPAVASLNSTNSHTSQKMTTLIQTVIPVANISQTVGQTVTKHPQTIIPTQTKLAGNISPSGPAKLIESHPQTHVRPSSVSSARPNVPICSPSVQRPSLPNQSRMTLRIPTSSLQTQNKVIVSFSPTVNLSAPILVSANSNKSIPAPRQTLAANIRPLQLVGNVGPVQFPGNVRAIQLSGNVRPLQLPANIRPILLHGNTPVPSASCPTLVSAILQKNQPHSSPAQVQSPTPPQIVAMFENKSSDLALQKRLKLTWSSKPIFPCRHCGAISRQPSLRVRHRYLHRGSRLYRCQCGRSFQRQIHLLRHQVQNAESVRFVCACCGRTFDGAHKLSRHKQESPLIHRQYAKPKCRTAFECTCGRVFARPSVLLWHMLKNLKPEKNTHKIHSALTC